MKPLGSLLRRAGEGQVDPIDALRAVRELRDELDRLEAARVDDAIKAGRPWSEVAGALGVTKQAAHKKHARRAADETLRDPYAGSVLVTSEARTAVRNAREEARLAGDDEVGTEHLLLGVLRCDYTVAVRALQALGVTLDAAREVVATTLVDGAPRKPSKGGEPSISKVARAALEQSLRETLAREEGYLGVEHLLLALVRDAEGGAARTLRALGVAAEEVRRQIDETAAASLELQG